MALEDPLDKAKRISYFILGITRKYGHQFTLPVYDDEDVEEITKKAIANNSTCKNIEFILYDVRDSKLLTPKLLLKIIEK